MIGFLRGGGGGGAGGGDKIDPGMNVLTERLSVAATDETNISERNGRCGVVDCLAINKRGRPQVIQLERGIYGNLGIEKSFQLNVENK